MTSFFVEIDPGLCMGAQRCSFLIPKSFGLNDEGIAEVIDPTRLTEEQADRAEAECPNLAISVIRHTDLAGALPSGEPQGKGEQH